LQRDVIFRGEMQKIDFGWGSGGAYSAIPDQLAGIEGAYF